MAQEGKTLTGRMRSKRATGTGRLYVIGDPDTGVIYVKTNPLRVARVPLQTIQQYAKDDGISIEEAFGRVAKGSQWQVYLANGGRSSKDDDPIFSVFKQLAEQETTVSDALFCFIADVNNDDWSSDRYRATPMSLAIAAIDPDNSQPNGDAPFDVGLIDTAS